MLRRNICFEEETLEKADKLIGTNGMKSRSDVIDKAINFYNDYINNREAGNYLNNEMQILIKSNLELVENRLGKRLGKIISELAIQSGITQRILAESLEVDVEKISEYRLETVSDIKENNSVIKYEKLD